MKNNLVFLLFWFCLTVANSSAAESGVVGTTGGLVLRLDSSVRAVGLGGAYTAINDNPDGILYNPAVISSMDETSLSYTHNEFLSNTRYDSLSLILPMVKPFGNIGTHLLVYYTDPIESTDLNGQPLPKSYFGYGTVGALSFGGNIHELLRAGINLKIFNEGLTGYFSRYGLAVDFGVQLRRIPLPWPVVDSLRIGFILRNIGLRFDQSQITLTPASFNFGCAYYLPGTIYGTLVFVVDTDFSSGRPPVFAAGAEYLFRNKFYLRFGYRYALGGQTNVANSMVGLSTGLGWKTEKYLLNYSYSPYANLGDLHRISVQVKF